MWTAPYDARLPLQCIGNSDDCDDGDDPRGSSQSILVMPIFVFVSKYDISKL